MTNLSTNLIEIGGIVIHADEDGRYSLNDLHRAAGGNPTHRPGEFMRNQQAIDLASEIDGETAGFSAVKKREGRGGGTFACKEMVYAYAMWISAAFHLKVIRTFDAIATGSQPPKLGEMRDAVQLFQPFFDVARLIGCDQQAAAISANQAVLAVSGANILQLMGRTHIEASNQESLYYTPTELGKRIGVSGQKMNAMIAAAGFQLKRDKEWELLPAGGDFARIYDTGKKHGSGVPIQQIKWSAEVIPALGKDAA